MNFQIDTSGVIVFPLGPDNKAKPPVAWENLSPFTKGYVEALFAEAARDGGLMLRTLGAFYAFSDLDPETLAQIIKDCDEILDTKPALYDQIYDGKMVWRNRQDNRYPDFPPLTVKLGDDGKVRFAA